MRVGQTVLDAVAAHARREQPRECCGLLIGTATELIEAVPARNVADDPTRRYEISPVDHFAQIKRCRASAHDGAPSLRVVGAYHSHPRSVPEPSPTDLAQAFEAFIYIIAGPVTDEAPCDIRAYVLRDGKLEPFTLTAA
jgi:proteasome lid subunit RPN8/RPN11